MSLASERFRTSCAWGDIYTTHDRSLIAPLFLETVFIDLIKFAATSLPIRVDNDPACLRQWLIKFTAWLWEILVENNKLIEVLDEHPDFAKELLYSGFLSNCSQSPWETEPAIALIDVVAPLQLRLGRRR